jgi:hypothetical protein
METSKEVMAINWASFISSLREHMEGCNDSVDHPYDADQTVSYNNKLPMHIYINKDKKDYHGIKWRARVKEH